MKNTDFQQQDKEKPDQDREYITGFTTCYTSQALSISGGEIHSVIDLLGQPNNTKRSQRQTQNSKKNLFSARRLFVVLSGFLFFGCRFFGLRGDDDVLSRFMRWGFDYG